MVEGPRLVLTKHCNRCDRTLDLTEFVRTKRSKNGYGSECLRCNHDRSRAWTAENRDRKRERGIEYRSRPEVQRRRHNRLVQKKFGISLDDYDELFAAQDGRCAICRNTETQIRGGGPRRLAVDHDHSTGQVRALLCSKCNIGIGQFDDDPERMLAAVAYLRSHALETQRG